MLDVWLFILSITLNLWFKSLAALHPDATCSPCLSRKLFAVDAALLRSEADTEVGSFLNELAVFRAACFWAKEVPVTEFVDVAGEPVDILENLA